MRNVQLKKFPTRFGNLLSRVDDFINRFFFRKEVRDGIRLIHIIYGFKEKGGRDVKGTTWVKHGSYWEQLTHQFEEARPFELKLYVELFVWVRCTHKIYWRSRNPATGLL